MSEKAMTTVTPGQVWADNDAREKGRTLRIDSVDATHATCTILTNSEVATYRGGGSDRVGKTTRIRLDRFKPTSTGYRLVDDTRPTT